MKPQLARSRIRNAVLFFAKNTEACGKIKLFKLLYLLDFEHFKLTGKSVTGFEYEAWKFGPVPVDLMQEWEMLSDDLSAVVDIVPEKVIDYTRETVKPREGVDFDDQDFTARQISIMEDLAARYRTTRSPTMIDVTHAQNGAWDRIWNDGAGARTVIPYELALSADDPHREAILEYANESKAIARRNSDER
jgi:uncharacterized phage-associated protein